jgi:hypothetical protein
MNFIPPSQFDAKLFLLTSRMNWKSLVCIFHFWIVYSNLIQKKFTWCWPKLKDLFILNNYVGIKEHNFSNNVWFWNFNFLCVFNLLKNSSFCKTFIKFCPPRMVVDDIWWRLCQDQIVMEHVSFCLLQSHASFSILQSLIRCTKSNV